MSRLLFITKRDALVEGLRAEILDGAISPGESLRQDAVARRFGVSTTPLREAMSILAAEGLLMNRPHRGFVVTMRGSFDSAEMEATFYLRAVLESIALRQTKPAAAREIAAKLATNVSDASEQFRLGHVAEFRKTSAAFHRELSRSVGSQITRKLLSTLDAHSVLIPGLDHRRMAELLREHTRILEALSTGRPDRAATIMELHMRRHLNTFRRARRRPRAEAAQREERAPPKPP